MILLLLGICLALCGLLALSFALWPLETLRVVQTLPPTLFAPP